jgi:hypothetical protein
MSLGANMQHLMASQESLKLGQQSDCAFDASLFLLATGKVGPIHVSGLKR